MKMRRNMMIEFLMTYSWAFIILALVITLISAYYINPDYKIYKMECRNETNEFTFIANNGCWIGCTQFFLYMNITRESLNSWKLCFNYCDEYLSSEEQICEDVEVEKIRAKDIYERKDCSKGTQVCLDFGYPPDISKPDLTQKWLKENCCCSEGIYKDINSKQLIATQDCSSKEFLEKFKLKECSKYKCGDYFVIQNGRN